MQEEKYSHYLDQINELLTSSRSDSIDLDDKAQKSIRLAELLTLLANEKQTPTEKKSLNSLSKILSTLQGRAIVSNLIDQSFRSKSLSKTLGQILHIFTLYGLPEAFPKSLKFRLLALKSLGSMFPKFSKNLIQKFLIKESLNILSFADSYELKKYLNENKKIDSIISLIQNPSFGTNAINNNLKNILRLIEKPYVKSICINVSDLISKNCLCIAYSQLEENLIKLYKKALDKIFAKQEKLIILNVENHKDLESAVAIFEKVLSREEFSKLKVGFTLDAYFPESFEMQKRLTVFAKKRYEKNGSSILIRIIKGFSLNAEHITSSKNNWPSATFSSKIETNANFKKMILFGSKLENIKAANLGIVTSNIFDIAFSLILTKENSSEPFIYFEIARSRSTVAIQKALDKIIGKNLKLFCPIVFKKDFHLASNFLLGKIYDTTNSDNFSSKLDILFPGSKNWEEELDHFIQSLKFIDQISTLKKQNQDRNILSNRSKDLIFENEPITDFSIKSNVNWAKKILEKAKNYIPEDLPIVINKNKIYTKLFEIRENPSNPNRAYYKYSLADANQIDIAIRAAKMTEKKSQTIKIEKKCEILKNVSQKIRENRAFLIQNLIVDIGKNFFEADLEISDAIDAIEYHINHIYKILSKKDVLFSPKGTILIIPANCFPLSTMAEAVASALVTGNVVLLKPREENALICYQLANLFWEANIPMEFLQFLNCSNDLFAKKLIADKRINSVMISTSAKNVQKLLKLRENKDLIAGTGGINTIIVTATADREQAILSIIDSAFSFSSQKFSSASILILEKEIYDDIEFKNNLKDACLNLKVGSALDLTSTVTPLNKKPDKELLKALNELDSSETWLIKPKQDPNNPSLFSPGIKYGTTKDSFTKNHELYAPVLSVMRANNLDHAIEIANDSKYALGAGLHSLDPREHQKWLSNIEAGNFYINSKITDAKIKRQPFGGYKKSCFGPGYKSGGENFLLNFFNISQKSLPLEKLPTCDWINSLSEFLEKMKISEKELKLWYASIGNYAYAWQRLSHDTDYNKIIGQDNIHRYVPRKNITLRVTHKSSFLDAIRVVAAAITCRAGLEISYENSNKLEEFNWIDLLPILPNIEESEKDFIKRVKEGNIARLRLVEKASKELQKAAALSETYIIDAPVLANGKFELLHYIKEISITYEYHRYGNFGIKESEMRRPIT
ncbi:MAG: 1-pyrroline-5-carboxylate dehydrogenase [Candidatus Anoxychlamydiales bacterium]|nr:1-pyrroline-5-carboxylate dehydrogenase [Candidatus Anoxychlamydiales bacterium]